MQYSRLLALVGFLLSLLFLSAFTVLAETSLLNVSDDVSRELYENDNNWQKMAGEMIRPKHSHRRSSKQALSMISGLQADVVSPAPRTPNVEAVLGPWAEVRKTHFADGGIYDQITVK
jgi:ABC-type sulfate transport system substrate-binding protein